MYFLFKQSQEVLMSRTITILSPRLCEETRLHAVLGYAETYMLVHIVINCLDASSLLGFTDAKCMCCTSHIKFKC